MPQRDLRVNIEGDEGALARSTDRTIAKLKALNKELDKVNGDNKRGFKDLAKTATSSTETASGAFSSMFSMIGKAGPANIALVAAGIAALPAVSVVAATGITAAVGGALLGVGLMAAAQSGRVKGEFEDLVADLKSEMSDVAAPLEDSLIHASGVARKVFAEIKPFLADAFEDLAPAFDRFVDNLGDGLSRLGPYIDPVVEGFNAILDELGAVSPIIFDQLGQALATLGQTAEDHASDIALFVVGLSGMVNVGAKVIAFLADAVKYIGFLFGPVAGIANLFAYDLATGMLESNAAAGQLKTGLGGVTTAANSGRFSVDSLETALNELSGATLDADEAAIRFRDALAQMAQAGKGSAGALNINTEAGRRNREAIINAVRAAQTQLTTMAAQGKSSNAVAVAYQRQRASLIKTAMAMGISRKRAIELISKYHQIPDSIRTRVTADTSSARSSITHFISQYSNRRIPLHIIAKSSKYAEGGLVGGYAAGGKVSGPGGSKADRIPAMLSRGEFVMNAAATRRNLPALEAINAGRSVAGGGGGAVHVTLMVGGQRFGDVVIDNVRKEVRTRGGDVQAALGRR